ncbi:MAG: hypothetical protein ACFFG0_14805 [Candidatus Thorarchaeota archaeon]
MPIVIGFIFTFIYNLTNVGEVSPFEIDSIFNFIVIIGINLIISGMIVNGVLNVEESGASVLSALTLIPHNQAKAKLSLMGLIQLITVLVPSLMYLGRSEFFISIITALRTLPFVLLFLLIIFELRVYFFGKLRYYYVVEVIHPEHETTKWALIFLISFTLYFVIIIF